MENNDGVITLHGQFVFVTVYVVPKYNIFLHLGILHILPAWLNSDSSTD